MELVVGAEMLFCSMVPAKLLYFPGGDVLIVYLCPFAVDLWYFAKQKLRAALP